MHVSKHPGRNAKNAVLRRIVLEFHKRAFGEEAARVNFLPAAARMEYLARIKNRARRRAQRTPSSRPS